MRLIFPASIAREMASNSASRRDVIGRCGGGAGCGGGGAEGRGGGGAGCGGGGAGCGGGGAGGAGCGGAASAGAAAGEPGGRRRLCRIRKRCARCRSVIGRSSTP